MLATKAGTIPLKIKHNEVQLGFITSREFPERFILPKGHINKSEAQERAALRETLEEAGWSGKIIGEPICVGKSHKISRSPNVFVAYHPMLVSKSSKTWPEKKFRSRIWISVSMLDDIRLDKAAKNVIEELQAINGKQLTRILRLYGKLSS